ncbi:cytochrome c [Thiobacillus sp.]|uniref:c-type cytochrome n=1 Tax=Thiobacillus sp. TaxID=924 RepID=UPI0025D0349A|nr:cytochrome c [Thiobacillus sp.]
MNSRQLASTFSLAGFILASCFMLPAHAADANGQYAKAVRNYDTYCVQCHGINRNGRGINSRDMSVQPRDHTDAKTMGDIPENEILKVIKEGGLAVNKSVLMPAWGNVLNDTEIREMAAYLRHVCNCGSGK